MEQSQNAVDHLLREWLGMTLPPGFDVQSYVDTALGWGLNLLAALIILLAGLWLAGRAAGGVRAAMNRTKRIDPMISGFIGSLARYAVIAITLIAVLGRFGIETTSIVALLGAAGLAIGLAMQGTLTHIAAGVMLLFFRPFKIDDYVEAGGVAGSVKDINLFTTEFATPDNVQIIVGNANVWGSTITNYSAYKMRRVDLVFGIDYGDDIDKAMAAIQDVVAGDARALREPEMFLGVSALGASSVDITLRAWCAAADYWPLRFDLMKAVKQRFDRDGITIPFPQRVVYYHSIDGDGDIGRAADG